MKKMINITKLLGFALIACFVLCLFVGCGDGESKGENSDTEK